MHEKVRASQNPLSTVFEPKTDRGETMKASHYLQLGGILSAGGEIGIRVTNEHHKKVDNHGKTHLSVSQHAIPEIGFTGTQVQVDKLKEMYGGVAFFDYGRNIPRWKIEGRDAVELAGRVKDFVPSRSAEIEAIDAWDKAFDSRARVRIASRLKEATRHGRISVEPQAYDELIKDPLFLTGVFESAGRIPESETGDDARIDLNSRNVPLLGAIRAVYGQNSLPVDQKGRQLTLEGIDAVQLLSIVKPHLAGAIPEYIQPV